jgi:hypothetical protein
VKIKASKKVTFRAGKELKEAVLTERAGAKDHNYLQARVSPH